MLKVSINDRALSNIISRNKKIEGRLWKGAIRKLRQKQINLFREKKRPYSYDKLNTHDYKNFIDKQ